MALPGPLYFILGIEREVLARHLTGQSLMFSDSIFGIIAELATMIFLGSPFVIMIWIPVGTVTIFPLNAALSGILVYMTRYVPDGTRRCIWTATGLMVGFPIGYFFGLDQRTSDAFPLGDTLVGALTGGGSATLLCALLRKPDAFRR